MDDTKPPEAAGPIVTQPSATSSIPTATSPSIPFGPAQREASGGGSDWNLVSGSHQGRRARPRKPARHPLMDGALAIIVIIIGIAIGYVVWGSAPASSPGVKTTPSTTTRAPSSSSSAALASKVDPELVDVNTILGYENEAAAGTGIVLTSSGRVLTNNHVINGATSISVTDVGNHKTYSATVVGYDLTGDVAVLQLQGASGLKTVSMGDSATVQVGSPVVALGNAGGTGGTPSIARGKVTALDQSITAVDEASGASEQLSGLIETNAPIQAGDSGGPLLDASGQVIGMNTAASTGYFFGGGTSQGYAIPSETARTLAAQITAGAVSATVHIGPTAFLGVEVAAFSRGFSSVTGAVVVGVSSGTPAESAGLVPGDVIVSINGQSVGTPTELTTMLQALLPGDTVQLGWQDVAGQSQSASVTLATGPAG
jgi:S1-C subfamily serine protease